MNLLKYAFGVFLIAILFSFVNFNDLRDVLYNINWVDIIYIVLVSFIFLLTQAFRLHMLIYSHVHNFYETAKLCFVSQFFSNFLPGGLAGDFYKIIFLKKSQLAISSAVTKIGIDRASGMIVLLIFSGFYFSTQSNSFINNIEIEYKFNLVWATGLLLLLPLIAIIKIYKSLVFSTIDTIKKDLAKIKRKNLIYFFIFCILVFYIRLIKFQIIFSALQYDFNFIDLIFLAFISQAAAMIPISIGGLGVIEASLFYGLKIFGVPDGIAFAFVLINRFTIWLVSIVGGLYWFVFKKEVTQEENS